MSLSDSILETADANQELVGGAECAPQAADPVAELRDSVRARNWAKAVKVISSHWAMFIEEVPADLDFALQAVPVEAFQGVPGAIAIREIWLWTSIEPQHTVPAEASAVEPEYADVADTLMRSHQQLREYAAVAADMVAARMAGRLHEALENALLLEKIGKAVEESIPASRRLRYPLALLQAGITRGVAGDIPGALLALQSAYERAPYGRSAYVAKGAAGNLALFHALAGDIDLARHWLTRHDELPSSESPHRERVLFRGDLARSLIAIESLDRDTAEESIAGLEQGINMEQTWGPVVTYVHARYGLVWGDRNRALAWVRRDIERYAVRLGPKSTLGPLLAAAEVDLLLAVRQGDQALACLNRAPSHPLLSVARARLELLAGDTAEAARLAAESLSLADTSRVRLEALVTQAVALLRSDQPESAREVYRMAQDAAQATDAGVALTAITEADRRAFDESQSAGGSSADSLKHPVRPLFENTLVLIRLTNQELLMLRALVSYGSQKEIAEAMFLSLNTIKTHLRVAYQKLGASGRAEALTIAGFAGLL